MIFSTVLYIANILVILSLIFYLVFLVSDRKYSLLKSVISSLIFGRHNGINWYLSNPLYVVRTIYINVLLLINITLIGQLMNSLLFNRTIWLLTLSPIVWSLVLISTWLKERDGKLKEF